MRAFLVAVMVGCVAGCVGERAGYEVIVPTRPVPAGLAPGVKVKVVKDTPEEKVYAVIFSKGDEVVSGLTDFAVKYGVVDAHFTAIGAASGGTVGWLDLEKKVYHGIAVKEQVEVLSMVGDVATYQGKPVVHAHVVLGKSDGSTMGGHLWELRVNPTLEVFVTANGVALEKRVNGEAGIKVIEP